MAISNIDQKKVGEAYENLKAEGLNPSLDRIRERLGTGSKGTIQAHLKAYLAAAVAKEEERSIELPDSVVSILKREFTANADSAKEMAANQYAAISSLLDESDQLRAELEQRVKDLESEAEEQQSMYVLVQKEHDKAAAATGQKISDLEKSNSNLGQKLEISVQGAESSRTELAKAQMQIERADKAAQTAETALAAQIAESQKLQKSLHGCEKELSTQTAIAEERAKAIAKLDADLVSMKQTLTKQAEEIKTETAAARTAEKEVAKQTAIAEEQVKAIAKLDADLVSMKEERDAAMGKKEVKK